MILLEAKHLREYSIGIFLLHPLGPTPETEQVAGKPDKETAAKVPCIPGGSAALSPELRSLEPPETQRAAKTDTRAASECSLANASNLEVTFTFFGSECLMERRGAFFRTSGYDFSRFLFTPQLKHAGSLILHASYRRAWFWQPCEGVKKAALWRKAE